MKEQHDNAMISDPIISVRGLTKNPRVKTLHKLALAFNMTLSEFLDFKELNDYSFESVDVPFNKEKFCCNIENATSTTTNAGITGKI